MSPSGTSPVPNQQRRPCVTLTMFATFGSSALRIAQPSASRSWTSSDFARAVVSIPPNSPTCAWPTLSTTATSSGTSEVSHEMWPMPRAPISLTRYLVSSSTRSAVRGTPISLFWLPSGATVFPSRSSTCAMRSLVEVLPEEPVTPNEMSPRLRASAITPRAIQLMVCTESSPRRWGMSASVSYIPTTALAPASAAAGANVCPSTRSPGIATNTAPGVTCRLSVTTSGPTTTSSPRTSTGAGCMSSTSSDNNRGFIAFLPSSAPMFV